MSLLVVLGAGCRWTGIPRARRAVIAEGLASERMTGSVEGTLAFHEVTTDCRERSPGQARCRAHVAGVWIDAEDTPDGGRFVVPPTLSEAQLTTFWKNLDRASWDRFSPTIDERVEAFREAEAAAFTPQWGLTGGISSGVVSSSALSELGAFVGVRRWFDINWGGFLAFDWSFRQTTPAPHFVGLRLGVELTRFTPDRFLGRIGAPPASVYAFIGPRLEVVPTVAPVIRTGLGVRVTDWYMAPVFIELTATSWFRADQSLVDFAFAIGFGL